MSEWNEVQLSDITVISSGKRPPCSVKEMTSDCRTPIIGGGGISGYTNAHLFDGDILITGRVGTLGKLFAPSVPCWPSDNALVIRPGSSATHPHFLRYALQSVIAQAADMNRGAANPLITQGDLGRLNIWHPPLPEQRAIAHILGTLDDKIELNRRQSETLQEMARALFKAWFVDFEPVRAKMSGRWQRGQSLPGLPAHLWDLFPERLVETESGEVPQGWEMRPVADFADIKGGKQLGKERIAETGQIPVFGGAGIMGYTDDYNAEGFVISVGRVGAYCGQFFRHRGKAWINNNASLIKQKEDYLGEWLFLALLHADIEVIKKGAAQPFVSNGDVAKLLLLWPQEQAIRAFSEIIVPLIHKQEGLGAETKQLAQLRDTLLPKLISGELRVHNMEEFFKRVNP